MRLRNHASCFVFAALCSLAACGGGNIVDDDDDDGGDDDGGGDGGGDPLPAPLWSLVSDVNHHVEASNPHDFAALGDLVVFAATAPDTGEALWRTDGTEAGTVLVTGSSSPHDFIAFAGKLYFFAGSDRDLWTTDGTAGGTFQITNTNGDPFGDDLFLGAAILGDRLLFVGNAGNRNHIWSTDGTIAGTHEVIELGYVGELTVAGGRAFFTGAPDVGSSDFELWSSDGTAAGTARVKDIKPGPSGGSSRQTAALGARALFWSDDGVHGFEPWSSDGTEAGTQLLADTFPGVFGTNEPGAFVVLGASAIFRARGSVGEELWRTDGTPAGTARIAMLGGTSTRLAAAGGAVYFVNASAGTGSELWKTAGTAETTSLVADLTPGPGNSAIGEMVGVGDTLFFTLTTPESGAELWRSAGTAATTSMVVDLVAGQRGSAPRDLTAVGAGLYYAASDDVRLSAVATSDGTAAGTRVIAATNTETADGQWRGLPFAALGDGSRVVFGASDPAHGTELWVAGDTTAPATLLADVGAGPADGISYSHVRVLGDRAVFAATDVEHGRELWVTDGTPEGTALLADLRPGPLGGASQVFSMTVLGDRVYFVGNDGEHGLELWQTDGVEPPAMVVDLMPLGNGARSEPVAFGDRIAMAGRDGEAGEQGEDGALFVIDDGVATRLSPRFVEIARPVASSGRIFFIADEALWTSDGTAEGTVELMAEDAAGDLTMIGDAVVFAHASGDTWTSDGTIDGTRFLTEQAVRDGVTYAGEYYFLSNGRLWATGLTEASTRQAIDLSVDSDLVVGGGLVEFGGLLHFSGRDEDHGFELYRSDGTAEGTSLARDVREGPESGSGFPVGAGGRCLYVQGDDGQTGLELWRLCP